MNFEQEKLNVFREISNIGSGNASTSLAKMLNEIVDIGIKDNQQITISTLGDGSKKITIDWLE